MKKFLALALAIVMLLCFAGCQKDGGSSAAASDAEKIVGSWTCTLDFSNYMEEYLGEADIEGLDLSGISFCIYMNFDFEADGTCTLYVDEDKTIESITKYIDSLTDPLVEYIYVTYENELGYSRDEIDELIETYYGMTVKEMVEEEMANSVNPETLSEPFEDIETSEGYYKLDNGKLYIADTEEELEETEDYVTYSFEGDTLKLDAGSDEDIFEGFEAYGIELPLVFEKN